MARSEKVDKTKDKEYMRKLGLQRKVRNKTLSSVADEARIEGWWNELSDLVDEIGEDDYTWQDYNDVCMYLGRILRVTRDPDVLEWVTFKLKEKLIETQIKGRTREEVGHSNRIGLYIYDMVSMFRNCFPPDDYELK